MWFRLPPPQCAGAILVTSTAQLMNCKWLPEDRHEWEGCWVVVWNGFDEECSFQTTEDALNALDSKEVEGEALEDGEDEEQVHKGSGMIYFNHHNS